jgi:carbamoyltransferase
LTAILGVSAFYHDAAAALVVDGVVVAAAQEERFSRIRHDRQFPRQAIDYCLQASGLSPEGIDHVVFYEKPFLKFERLLETYLACAPAGFRSFLLAMPQWIHEKLRLPQQINRGLGGRYRKRLLFLEHHESHAASAFFPSPFEEAAILTLDGVGEWATASLGRGQGNRIQLTHELRFPHSLGLLYSAFTYFCGFKVNSGEYKLMGLAPYGRPTFAATILERLIDLKADGSFRLDLSYFDFCAGLTMTSAKFERLFGGPARPPESPLTQREFDLAASIQSVTETVLLRMAGHLHAVTGSDNLCLAGGVALNCVGNGRLLRESPFRHLWIQPAAGDAGGALGAALFVWHQLLEHPRRPGAPDSQRGSLLGPAYSDASVAETLLAQHAVFRHFGPDNDLERTVAQLIADGQVVGWMQGRMEFGPRALGARSILGDARDARMQHIMNLKIKFRESFRPFAPIVLEARAADYFALQPGQTSPYMLLVAPVRPGHSLPAVTHVDGSARLQTVDGQADPALAALLEAFEALTGCAVMINTSFNIRGEPIVCTAADAYRCFMGTEIDALVIGRHLLLKADQPAGNRPDRAEYLAGYRND